MSDDIKVGDVVVCVNDDVCPVTLKADSYVKGRLYRVAEVKTGTDNVGRPATGLKAVGLQHELYRNVVAFRKLPAADAETTALIRACRPKRELVPTRD